MTAELKKEQADCGDQVSCVENMRLIRLRETQISSDCVL